MMRHSWTMAMAVLSVAVTGAGAFDYQAYRPYRLCDAIKEQAATRIGDWNMVGADFRYRVTVSFSGELRKIDPKSRTLIGMWAKSVSVDPKVADMFTHEVRVVEDDKSYWLPIQKVLVESLKSEVKAGHKVDLFVTWIGSTKLDFIFLVNEFDAGTGA